MTDLNQTTPLDVPVEHPVSTPEKPFRADLARYPARPWLRHQSIWAIAIYRFGRWNDRTRRGPIHWIFDRVYWLLYRIVETLLGISFTKTAQIGPGLRIYHFGCIVIHNQVKIGSNCTLRHGVTIGNRSYKGPVPTIGDNVEIGAFAQILGPIHIGDDAKIGAMSVVLQDVPPGASAVGNPARIILKEAPGNS